MKICAAQTRPSKGDIERNIDSHKKLIDLAVFYNADIIIFPELSLTGYEPTLAKKLATHLDDSRFDDFQKISDAKHITIGVGVPIKNKENVSIAMLLFQPQQERKIYFKKYLHADEDAFFISGENFEGLTVNNNSIALAICYEISIPQHWEDAFKNGAAIYMASVAKFENGIDKAFKNLSDTAHKYSATVLMSNCVGQCDGHECAGRSSVWNNAGILVGQLDDSHEGIIMFDTDSQEVKKKMLN